MRKMRNLENETCPVCQQTGTITVYDAGHGMIMYMCITPNCTFETDKDIS